MNHYCPDISVILVACKKDLRYDAKTIEDLEKSSQTPVSFETGMACAEKIGAYKYVECSAKSGEGVKEVFEYATRASLLSKTKKKRACLLL